MNVPDMNVYNSLPPRYTKNQAVFGKYAASQAALQGTWSPDANTAFNPHSPMVYGMSASPQSLGSVKHELMTPDSFQTGTVSPEDLLTADNSPLFDDIDGGDMHDWESLFLDENVATTDEKSESNTQQSQLATIKPGANFDFDFEAGPDVTESKPEITHTVTPVPNTNVAGSETDGAFGFSLDFSVLNEEEPLSEAPISPRISDPTSTVSSGRITKSRSPSTPTIKKVDDLGITVYKRKPRNAPLKPVEVPEECGDVAVKRAKNTEAARRSRARKLERMSQLEIRVRELLDENDKLKAEISQLKGE